MLSEYFKSVVYTDVFKESTNKIINELKDKKVLIYGAGEAYFELKKLYDFDNRLNIIGLADLKFASNDKKEIKKNNKTFKNVNMVKPKDIPNTDFDEILVTNEYSKNIVRDLKNLGVDETKIKPLFVQEIKDESINLTYLYKNKFNKNISKLIKKLKNKKVVLYGAGAFLETIKKYFDISGLNVIGISDKKYIYNDSEQEFLGYKTYAPEKIKELNPDYVIVCTKFYLNIVEDIYENITKDTKIKIKPLVKKSFWTLFKEAMNS